MPRYHHSGCRLITRISIAIIGVLLGFSASLCFAVIYLNYHCSGWAFVSGVFALIVLCTHLTVWKDVTYNTNPMVFMWLMMLGIFGSVLGFCVFIGYLWKGIMVHEKGVQIHGWFIVTVWGYMTWKWGFLLFIYSKNYVKALKEAHINILSVNPNERMDANEA